MQKPIVFMYSGQGAQYYQMGKELYDNNAVFRDSLNRCAAVVDPLIGTSLVSEIYRGRKSEPFDKTRYTHPGNVAVAYSLTQVLYSQGIRPDYLLGYSLGEYIAAIVSGAVELEAGMANITQHALLLEEKTQPATMLAILENPQIMTSRSGLFANASLACHNFQKHFVVSGSIPDLKNIEKTLFDDEITVQMLPITHGFHSPYIDPAHTDMRNSMVGLFGTCNIPCFSAMAGGLIDAYTPDHMWNVMRQPVRFYDLLLKVENQLSPTYIDVGPAGTLATFAKYALGPKANGRAHMSINQFGRDLKSLEMLNKAIKG